MPPYESEHPKWEIGEIEKYQNYCRIQYQAEPFVPFQIDDDGDDDDDGEGDKSFDTAQPAIARFNNPNVSLRVIYEQYDDDDNDNDSDNQVQDDGSSSKESQKTATTRATFNTMGMTSLATQKLSNVKTPLPKPVEELEDDDFGDASFDDDLLIDTFYSSFDLLCCNQSYRLRNNACTEHLLPCSKQGATGSLGRGASRSLRDRQKRVMLLERRRRRFQAFSEQQDSYKMNATPRGFEFDEFVNK
eukprot:CAMPEP_0113311592 /NCGR_PEP_ID=MMETSP0010_2-20120614/8765_1 /TAXON_ID=216773 ORGANISM="Corethron hystrix, Strain 308" /NCGR_SAMPLE_ID=MMETSP0010_2 /ASSEMBLY_ACC=CAM_ASM_000155 /LENGTH=244 /DNA_ID=CAMNT_0000167257 /DNA_START=109 /DNA_END=843 /DNA_ORIENTATION=- /assembly_acc=CAM_ASM_000155